MKFFSKLNYFISGYFDPTNYFFLIIKINNFWGGLSGISAKTATLVVAVAGADLSPLFDLEPGVCHLNHGSYGAALRVVSQSAALWRTHMEHQPSVFFEEDAMPSLISALSIAADFVGADVSEVAPLTNATAGLSMLVHSIPLTAGDFIVVLDVTYPAVKNAVAAAAAKAGASVIEVETGLECVADPQLLTERLDAVLRRAGPRVKVAVLDHVVSFPPIVLPVQDMVRVCRKVRDLCAHFLPSQVGIIVTVSRTVAPLIIQCR